LAKYADRKIAFGLNVRVLLIGDGNTAPEPARGGRASEAHDSTRRATVAAGPADALTEDAVSAEARGLDLGIVEDKDMPAVSTAGAAPTRADNTPAVATRTRGTTDAQ